MAGSSKSPNLPLTKIEELFAFADLAKDHRDFDTANRVFVALLHLALSDRLEGVRFEYEVGKTVNDTQKPYYHLLVLVISDTGARLCLPRPKVAVAIFDQFMKRAHTVKRRAHNRAKLEEKNFRDEFLKFDLAVPEGWLLAEYEDRARWMTADEIHAADLDLGEVHCS